MADQTAAPPAASSAQPAPAKPAPKKRRRWPWILLGILVLILLFVALLPTIASTGPVRRMVLGRVNQQLNGTATIDSWSLGWFSGFRLNGIRLADRDGHSVAEVQSVTLPASVPTLLGSLKQLGTVAIESPKANLVLYADGTNNFTNLVKQTQAATSSKPPAAPQPQALGFDVTGDITVRNGEISVQPAGDAKPVLVRDLNVEVKIESLEKPVHLDVKAALGEERAALAMNGSATVLHAGKLDPAAVEADVGLTLTGLQIGPFAALARQYGSPVEAAGILTVQRLEAQVRGMDSIKAAGDIGLKQLALSGGPLGKDQPKFDHIGLTFAVSKTGQTMTITDFKFDSPVATASASGSLVPSAAPGNLPRGNLTAAAQVDLPALTVQLPNTLRLQKGLTIESGTVKLDAKLASGDQGARVDGSLRVENVAAIRDGQRIALDAPITLDLKAAQTVAGLRIELLDLASSFASAHGAGSLEKFDLEIKSDLAAALREAAKFVDLAGKRCAGQATVALHLAGPEREKILAADVTLTDLALEGFTPRPVTLKEAKVTLGATALLDEKNALQSVNGLKVELTAPFATGTISADSVALAPGQPLPTLRNGKIILKAELGDVADFAGGAGLMPADIGLLGELNLSAGLAVEKGAVRLAPIDITVADLDASQGKKHLREPKLALSGSVEANPAARNAKIRDLKCDLSAGSIAVESLDVPDWAMAPAGVTATITGALDLERALAAFKDFAALPAGMNVAGQAKFTLKAASLATAQSVNVDVAVNSLKITPATGPAIEEPKLSVVAAADIAPLNQTVALNSLAIQSSFYSLDAKGSLTDWSKMKNLTLDGTQECDWEKIGPLVAAFSGQPVEMSGKDKKPLHVVASLGAEGARALLASAAVSAALHIDLLKVMGFSIAPLDGAVQIKDSVATANITAKVNDGALKLPAKVDASKDTPELTLPPNTAILTDAKITPAMADEALSKALPIFKGCTVAAGSVSMDSKSLNAPLGEGALQKAAFEGGLGFKGVKMSTAGQLQSILGAVNLAGAGGMELASVQDQRVSLSLRNGRVYQGPMQIALAGYTVKISGSVGLVDKTLDMVAEMPVTLAMVGGRKDIYPYVKDQTLRLTIKGTTDKPEYSVKQGLQDLVKGAAKKLAEDEAGKLLNKGIKNIFK